MPYGMAASSAPRVQPLRVRYCGASRLCVAIARLNR